VNIRKIDHPFSQTNKCIKLRELKDVNVFNRERPGPIFPESPPSLDSLPFPSVAASPQFPPE